MLICRYWLPAATTGASSKFQQPCPGSMSQNFSLVECFSSAPAWRNPNPPWAAQRQMLPNSAIYCNVPSPASQKSISACPLKLAAVFLIQNHQGWRFLRNLRPGGSVTGWLLIVGRWSAGILLASQQLPSASRCAAAKAIGQDHCAADQEGKHLAMGCSKTRQG